MLERSAGRRNTLFCCLAVSTETRRNCGRLRLKCDGTRAETKFCLSAKLTSPLSRRGRQFSRLLAAEVCVCISGSNVGYTMFRGSEKCTGYPLHSPISPSLPLPCVTVCHHISTGLYCSFKITISTSSSLEVTPAAILPFPSALSCAQTHVMTSGTRYEATRV